MTMTGYSWESLIRELASFAPAFIVWGVAIYFCFVRRRENPKGATFLGLAILVAFVQVAFSFLVFHFPMAYSRGGSTGMAMILGFAMMMSVTVGNAAKWILVTLAVFARRPHYDFTDESVFDDEKA